MNFVLLDLERTVQTGMAHYWNQNMHGYTQSSTRAGKFTIGQARKEVYEDKENLTIAIPMDRFDKLRPQIFE